MLKTPVVSPVGTSSRSMTGWLESSLRRRHHVLLERCRLRATEQIERDHTAAVHGVHRQFAPQSAHAITKPTQLGDSRIDAKQIRDARSKVGRAWDSVVDHLDENLGISIRNSDLE